MAGEVIRKRLQYQYCCDPREELRANEKNISDSPGSMQEVECSIQDHIDT